MFLLYINGRDMYFFLLTQGLEVQCVTAYFGVLCHGELFETYFVWKWGQFPFIDLIFVYYLDSCIIFVNIKAG